MNAKQIRTEGITAPGSTFVGGDSHSDINAVINNIAILCGAAQEIAAQLAEINRPIYVEFKTEITPRSIWINPKAVIAVCPHPKGGTTVCVGPAEEDYLHVQDEPHEVVQRLQR